MVSMTVMASDLGKYPEPLAALDYKNKLLRILPALRLR
jgi:hypothetical protein